MYHHATSNPLSRLRFLVVCAVLLLGAVEEGYGQRVYADVQRNGGGGNINNTGFSVNDDYTDHTRLTAPTVIGSVWQQLIFPTTLSANSIVYLKFTTSTPLLGGGISVQAYANSASSTNGTAVTTNTTFFTSVDGMTYAAVTSQSAFNAVRLSLSASLTGAEADIYYAFFEAAPTGCSEAIGTSVGGSGISIGGNVSDRLNAIDNDLTTYSTLDGGILEIGNTISQSAYFASKSYLGSAATVTFSVPPNILSLGLFNNVTINTYNGFDPNPVSSTPLNSLLSLDLLGLLSAGDEYTVSVVPSGQFDRIEVSVATGVGLLSSFHLHEIQRTPAPPEIGGQTAPYIIELCDGEDATIILASPSNDRVLRWYDENGLSSENVESTGNPDEYNYLYSDPGEYKISVAAAWASDCIAESERTELTVIVHPKPGQPSLSINSNE